MNGDWPSLTPDGTKLAFTSSVFHSTIWRKDLLHPDLPPERLYASTLQENEGRYSPDGKRVAFDSARSGVWSVWMADGDGSNLVQLSHAGAAGYPRWSPDSQKIAFEAKEDDGSTAIYVAAFLIVSRASSGCPSTARPLRVGHTTESGSISEHMKALDSKSIALRPVVATPCCSSRPTPSMFPQNLQTVKAGTSCRSTEAHHSC